MEKKKILIVEDEIEFAEMVKVRLEGAGYSANIATDAYEGNKEIMNTDYDLIVLDLAMPVGSGLELLEHVREHPNKAEIPVVIVTGKLVDDYVLDKAKALNVSAIFTKPYDSELFIEKVTSLVPIS